MAGYRRHLAITSPTEVAHRRHASCLYQLSDSLALVRDHGAALHRVGRRRMSAHGRFPSSDASVFEGLQIIKPVPWLEDLGHSDIKTIVRQASYALWWIARHQEVIPTKIPGMLHKAGMLKTSGGMPVMRQYFSGAQSPYIDRDDFLSD
jgi:hypothetical protein